MICVFGSINMDLTATTDRLPTPGETVSGNSFATAPGGKGANQALAATRAGAHVKMAGAVGQDDFAASSIELLKTAGTDLSFVKSVKGPTGTALILVGGDGENMIAVVPGANGKVVSQDAEELLSSMNAGDSILLQMEIGVEAVKTALISARKQNVRSVFNTAPMAPEAIALAPLADIIVANETEFDLLIEKGTLSDQQRLDELERYAVQTGCSVVITLGGDGVIAQHEGVFYQTKGLTIEPVDTVGAGDTFCGYLTQGLDAGLSFETSLEQAAIAGSLACLKAGAQPAIPTASDVAAAIKSA
jgi:ribokinase